MAKKQESKDSKDSKLSDKLADWVGKSSVTIADAELASMERACLTLPMFLQSKAMAIIEKHKKDKSKFVADRKAKVESIIAGRVK